MKDMTARFILSRDVSRVYVGGLTVAGQKAMRFKVFLV